MSLGAHVKVYAACVVVFFALDLTWLGVVAKGFYNAQMGHLLRPDVQWGAALLFYLIYVAAIVVLCVVPAVEKQSMGRALALGAVFGLAAYAAFDLTSLALLKDFPTKVVYVDLAWGMVLTASVSAAGYWAALRLG
ncbi:MAG: DUF2177 family protein [Gemmatimonadaceae bacterium]|nr:DUF2177 family protein [Gemmatimonadaceae bacterium]